MNTTTTSTVLHDQIYTNIVASNIPVEQKLQELLMYQEVILLNLSHKHFTVEESVTSLQEITGIMYGLMGFKNDY